MEPYWTTPIEQHNFLVPFFWNHRTISFNSISGSILHEVDGPSIFLFQPTWTLPLVPFEIIQEGAIELKENWDRLPHVEFYIVVELSTNSAMVYNAISSGKVSQAKLSRKQG
jgi:hypothetical protein